MTTPNLATTTASHSSSSSTPSTMTAKADEDRLPATTPGANFTSDPVDLLLDRDGRRELAEIVVALTQPADRVAAFTVAYEAAERAVGMLDLDTVDTGLAIRAHGAPAALQAVLMELRAQARDGRREARKAAA